MTKKPTIDEEDQALFRAAMRGMTPIRHTKITLHSPPPKRSKPTVEKDTSVKDLFSDVETLPPVNTNDILQFSRPGIQNKILRNLRNGKYNVEAVLDLHGKTVIEARSALAIFLLKCEQRRIKHALIIHGKGRGINKPVLKNKLNHWLRQTDQVLAFCSATIRDGRAGALYVLLKGG